MEEPVVHGGGLLNSPRSLSRPVCYRPKAGKSGTRPHIGAVLYRNVVSK